MTGNCGWLLVIILTMASGPVSAAIHVVRGEARDPANGQLLYREQHLIRSDGHGDPLQRLVLYRCPSGAAFARKRVDYRTSAIAPAFALIDARDGYHEGLRRDDGRILVWSGIGPPRPEALDRGARPLVADAGFDEFLRAHWDALLAGQAQALAFAVPARGRALEFEVEYLGAGEIGGTAVERFELQLDGLLGLIGPSITVAYTASGHHLRRFSGLTNLRDDDGEPLHAHIDFAKPPQAARTGAWPAALAEPLVDCELGR